jgi:hypothetical protein
MTEMATKIMKKQIADLDVPVWVKGARSPAQAATTAGLEPAQ